jgi:hypothetical protein
MSTALDFRSFEGRHFPGDNPDRKRSNASQTGASPDESQARSERQNSGRVLKNREEEKMPKVKKGKSTLAENVVAEKKCETDGIERQRHDQVSEVKARLVRAHDLQQLGDEVHQRIDRLERENRALSRSLNLVEGVIEIHRAGRSQANSHVDALAFRARHQLHAMAHDLIKQDLPLDGESSRAN